MKRKDWKIKKSKKILYGSFYKSYNLYFLRKLFIKKTTFLLKKNIKPNFIYFNSILNKAKLTKNIYMYKNYFLIKNNFYKSLPIFLIKKSNEFELLFKNFTINNNYDFFSLNKNIYKKIFFDRGVLFNIYNKLNNGNNNDFIKFFFR